MNKILIIGSINVDLVFKVARFVQAGETLASEGMRKFLGGKGLNQAIALAKAYGQADLAANIGTEDASLIEAIRAYGVQADHIRKMDLPTGMAFIQVNPEGQNCIVLNSGANCAFTEDRFKEVLDAYTEGDLLVLQNEINGLDQLIPLAKAKGLRIALNPSPWSDDLNRLPLHQLDVLILNEIEGAAITGETDPAKIMAELENRFPMMCLVLTLGAEGSIARYRGVAASVPAEKVKVVDTTAAGDTFLGYFLASYLEGQNLEASLHRATHAAALAVSRPGAAASIPERQEVMAYEKS